jgi:D-glycero-D-manno-heptose 1,7-bisphosphate phosphatase
LTRAGYAVGIVTNQEWVGRGWIARADHDAIMGRVAAELERAGARLDAGAHAALDASTAKPRPDLLLAAARDRDLDLAASFMVGDNAKDVLAGKRAGCRAVLVDPRLRTWLQGAARRADHVARDLPAAVDWVLSLDPRA